MSRRKLSTTIVSEDETRCYTHKELQAENSRGLSYLQAAHRSLLLSCEALQGKQMSCAVLSKHQAEAAAAELGSKVNSVSKLIKTAFETRFIFLQIARSSIQPTTSGCDEHSNGSNVESNSSDHCASNARRIQGRNESRCSQSSPGYGWNGKPSPRGYRNETRIAETSASCIAGCETGEN